MSADPNSGSSRLRAFGPFTFDERTGELRKSGVRIRMTGQPQRILATLLREPGRIVSREELHQELWSGSTFVDFEHGLNAAMNRLRNTLRDSPDKPRYIETLSGRGYRFIADVVEPESKPLLVMSPRPAAAEQPWPPTSPQPALRTVPPVWLGAAFVAAILASAAIGYWIAARPKPLRSPTIRFVISPPDGYQAQPASSRQTFTLSPDGTQLAFTAKDASGVPEAFIRNLQTLETTSLPKTRGISSISWAPDGRSLLVAIAGEIRRVEPKRDAYQVISDAPAIPFNATLLGSTLLISARRGSFTAPTSGGSLALLKDPYPWAQVMPDGKHVLYAVLDGKLGHHRARIAEFGKPDTARDLLVTDSKIIFVRSVLRPGSGHLLYVKAGNLIAHPFDPDSLRIHGEPFAIASQIYSFFPTGAADFSASDTGLLIYQRYATRSQLAWVDRQGNVKQKIGPSHVNVRQGRLSPDGTRIAAPIYDVNRGVTDIWIIDSDTSVARRAVFGPGLVDNPVWGPDSRTLVGNGVYDRPPKLFMRGIGEADPIEPLPEADYQVPTDWSPDGRFLAFTNTAFTASPKEMKGDVWLIDMARGRKIIPLIRTPFHEEAAAFSPDGRWLAFTSDETGRPELYIQAFDAKDTPRLVGDRHLVSRTGVLALRWRADGRELYYLAWDGRIYAVPLELGAKPNAGSAVPLFTVSSEARAAIHSNEGFDVSKDGQRFLVPIVNRSERTEFIAVQNWEAPADPAR